MTEHAEPTDPAAIKADMQKCPRWILAKLQSERKNRIQLEADLEATIPLLEKRRAELEAHTMKVKALEESISSTSDVSQLRTQAQARLQAVEDAIRDRDISILDTETKLEFRKEELASFKRFVKELQETKTREHNQLKESILKLDVEIQEKQELINKLKQELARYGNFLKTRVHNPA